MTKQDYKDALLLATLQAIRALPLEEILEALDEQATNVRGDMMTRDLRQRENVLEQAQGWTTPQQPTNDGWQ